MKRELKDFKQIKVNLEVINSVEYQDLVEEKKRKIDEYLPNGAWQPNESLTWEQVENKAFTLMKTKGICFKLFSIWSDAQIFLYGWQNLEFIFSIFEYLITEKKDILLLEGEEDQQQQLILFWDKNLAFALTSVSFKLESKRSFLLIQINQFKHNILANFTIKDIEEIKKYCENISILLKKNEKISLTKIYKCIESLLSIIPLYNAAQEAMESATQEQEEILDIQSILEKKNEAMLKIKEALALLMQVDEKNVSILLLKKAILWHNYSILDVLTEMQEVEKINSLIKLLN